MSVVEKILVDSTVWVHALSTKDLVAKDEAVLSVLTRIVRLGCVAITGLIRQELLSGIKDISTYHNLRQMLSVFPDERLVTLDFEYAAQCRNTCMTKGIEGPLADFTLCSYAIRSDSYIFTLDENFRNYAKALPIRLLDWTKYVRPA